MANGSKRNVIILKLNSWKCEISGELCTINDDSYVSKSANVMKATKLLEDFPVYLELDLKYILVIYMIQKRNLFNL